MFQKQADLPSQWSHVPRSRPFFLSWSRLLQVLSLSSVIGIFHLYRIQVDQQSHSHSTLALCPQVDSLAPVKHADMYKAIGALIETNVYKLRAVKWLAGAIQVPTESYDDMKPVGQDPRWEVFESFHGYLHEAFPLVHEKLKLTKVNTYGLVFHWQGSDKSLKPLLLTAHQDVVPVDKRTVNQWIHPPYSGHFDGTYVWGRGSSDDKSGLISIMATVETLLGNQFVPTRSLVLAFGFDEEASGQQGAQQIAKYLLRNYGENGFALLVDEGGGWTDMYGAIVVVPSVGEKGYIDVRVEVRTPGGHSSVPPKHTSIGVLSSLLVAIEANPLVPHIGRTQPTYGMLQCLAEHTPDIPSKLRKNIKDSVSSDAALRRLEEDIFEREVTTKALVGTTQAIDIIAGGVKTNALPEQAYAIINHRVATDSSLDVVKEHLTTLLTPYASKFNLSFTAFEKEISSDGLPRYGSLNLSDAFDTALSPAPVSPTDSEAFKLLSGSIKQSLRDLDSFRDTNASVVVAPGITSGNTDTMYYLKLTPNIVRYNHNSVNDTYGEIHTINEAMKISGIQSQIRFFTILIFNSDESTAL